MPSDSYTTKKTKTPLNNSNFAKWVGDTAANLREIGCYGIITGTIAPPASGADDDKIDHYNTRLEKAAGIIYNALEDGQKVHVRGIDGDPVAMWRKLESVHSSKKASQRFSAYDALFSL